MNSTSSHEKNGLFSAPLSFAQERLWVLDQINSGNTVHNIPLAIHFKGVLNVKALEQSLREIVQRHQALRMTVTTINGQRPFFFCASSLSEVLPLANCLGQEQPIYLMESALVVFSDKPTENNIKALAAHHVRDILAIQPEGDYILGG